MADLRPSSPESGKAPSRAARIYERPERKGVSPLLIAVGLLVLAVIIFFLYKAVGH